MTVLYRRLGVGKSEMPIKIIMDGIKKSLEKLNKAKYPDDIISNLSARCDLLAFYFCYLEQFDEAKKYAQRMIDYTLEYFFGDWRNEIPIDGNPPDAELRKKYEPWTRQFRPAIFWASCLGDWEKVRELAEYPTKQCPVGRYEPKLFCYWLLLLAGVLRGESLNSLQEYVDKVSKSRRRYYILLFNMLKAILDADSEHFNHELEKYLDYCNEHTFNRPEIDEKVSIDGTFLINYARHRGLKVEYPEKYKDRIVVLKTDKSLSKQGTY